MKVFQTSEIRNIALIGGSKSGKTTLGEAMLFEGGMINRRGSVEDKNTVSDYRPIELERQNSVVASVLCTLYDNRKINIIDTPGFDDFIGEVVAALKVADTALMVVNAQNGVEVGTEITWRYTTKNQTPVIFVVNHLDQEHANFDETIRQLHQQFGKNVTLMQYPVNAGTGFNSIIDLLKKKMYKYPQGGGKPEITDVPDAEKAKTEELHNALIEELASKDESLMEVFFEKGTLTEEEIAKALRTGIIHRSIFPVLCVCSKQDMGVGRLLEFIVNSVPSPDAMPPIRTKDGKELKCNPSEPASAFVFKTTIEPHLGEVSFFKVYAGEITEAMDMINPSRHGSKERLSQLFVISGKNRDKVEKLVSGDIGATIRLKNTFTNNTLNSPKNPDLIIEPMVYPEPKYRAAVKAKNQGDDEKLGSLLSELTKMDPTLVLLYSKELKQVILMGQGELHLNIAKWQLENLEKIGIDFLAPKIPYRETITKLASLLPPQKTIRWRRTVR